MSIVLSRIKEMYPRSLLAEFYTIFGEATTIKIIDVFSGTTLEIPSRKSLEVADRDIRIYEALCPCTSSKQTRAVEERMAEKYELSIQRVREIYKNMKRQMGENKRFQLADKLTGKLRRSTLKVEHRSKRK
jgi:hypothetical protein